jgi:predicted nucleic acid-binding protein
VTADTVYADPSALLKLYRRETGSMALAAWRSATTGALPLTLHGELEIVNAIFRYRHAGIFTPEKQRAAVETFEEDIASGRYRREDPGWRAVMRRSKELTVAHTAEVGTRTLDVLHVAAALEIGLRHFLTFDERQSALAVRAGLKLVTIPVR